MHRDTVARRASAYYPMTLLGLFSHFNFKKSKGLRCVAKSRRQISENGEQWVRYIE